MPMTPIPLTRDLLLVGGGHAHALLLRRWGMDPLAGVRLTVVNPGPTAPYTGMLPGFVAGHYTRAELDIDLVRLARHAGARLILGKADALDRDARTVNVTGRGPLRYDVVSFDVGIHSDMPDLPGFRDHGVPAKPLDRFAQRWADYLNEGRDHAAAGLAVIGGGVAGAELAMAMAFAARTSGPVHVIEQGAALRGIGDGAARALRARMANMGITLLEHVDVALVDATGVTLTDGRHLSAGFVTGAAGARPHDWIADTDLPLDDGFIRVGATLQSPCDPDVFAVGDCAQMNHAPRPKAGVFAVRQAPVLHRNLRARLGVGRMGRYHPQKSYLKLISLGGKSALADKFGRRLEGPLLWRWKDRIDRAFMDRLGDLPAMQVPPPPGNLAQGVREALADAKPMCGGCGSKLGRGGLDAALAALPGPARDDVQAAPGDDAAILCFGDTRQVISTDHLRAFTEDPATFARITANHALGDVFAMGARAQAALATVILPRATPAIHADMMAEIMGAARTVFAEAGADIVGGHTLIGDALSLGFTVTGIADAPIMLEGAQAGDALILTKPIGTGVILAAEMAMAARGGDVVEALKAMGQSQARAAAILKAAHAMTDVTGFGLAGHLMGMLDASGLCADIVLGDVPLLPGAAALSRAGHRSTLFPENRAIVARMNVPDTPDADLLFDPQTAGGLLAAVAPEDAVATVEALKDAGYPAAIVGELRRGAPFIAVR